MIGAGAPDRRQAGRSRLEVEVFHASARLTRVRLPVQAPARGPGDRRRPRRLFARPVGAVRRVRPRRPRRRARRRPRRRAPRRRTAVVRGAAGLLAAWSTATARRWSTSRWWRSRSPSGGGVQGLSPNDPFYDFFRRFGIPAPGQQGRAPAGARRRLRLHRQLRRLHPHQHARGGECRRGDRAPHRPARVPRQGHRRRRAHRRRGDQDQRDEPADREARRSVAHQARAVGARHRLAVRLREQRHRRASSAPPRARCRGRTTCPSSRPTWR